MIIWKFNGLSTVLVNTIRLALSSQVNNSELIPINFIEGSVKKRVLVKEGENLFIICKRNNIKIIGACDGNCACSTCHIILEANLYKKLPPPSESEEDMLDLAYGVSATSRLACQIQVTKDFKNTNILILEKQRNLI